jgi:hypothetical protein
MTLGSSLLLRRLDTDFVNISPMATHLGISPPSPTLILNAVVITKGSPGVVGTWVPLSYAQTFVREHPLPGGLLDVFLSDALFERFPPALQDFHRTNAPGRLLNQFGPHFSSTLIEVQRQQLALRTDLSSAEKKSLPLQQQPQQQWGREPVSEWDVQEDLSLRPTAPATVVGGPFPIALMLMNAGTNVVETPLSATEQEMFHVLCAMPEWEKEKENSPPLGSLGSIEEDSLVIDVVKEYEDSSSKKKTIDVCDGDNSSSRPSHAQQANRPLRRSKRVANAAAAVNTIAANTRSGSKKRGARNSLT